MDNSKIVDIEILRGSTERDLVVAIRKYIKDGWVIYWHPFLNKNGNIMQVLVKYEEV